MAEFFKLTKTGVSGNSSLSFDNERVLDEGVEEMDIEDLVPTPKANKGNPVANALAEKAQITNGAYTRPYPNPSISVPFGSDKTEQKVKANKLKDESKVAAKRGRPRAAMTPEKFAKLQTVRKNTTKITGEHIIDTDDEIIFINTLDILNEDGVRIAHTEFVNNELVYELD